MSIFMRSAHSKNYIQVPLDAGYAKPIPISIAQIDWFLVHDIGDDNEKHNINSYAGSIDKSLKLQRQLCLNNRFRSKI
ncbi:hypothetical protein BpHYR1_030096 [Brachionus plicatilis]|uniref:Uncharacterized protein n=1 Tax=Brachionus plicatilis TaxID=10195 RepID=A0A3M7QAK9_BRAPC|nr:hypothetical protein BpHYR1_030096 [Brachionus plicatilis]